VRRLLRLQLLLLLLLLLPVLQALLRPHLRRTSSSFKSPDGVEGCAPQTLTAPPYRTLALVPCPGGA
jgi:hypothetical protein